jgi:hypothetical protein
VHGLDALNGLLDLRHRLVWMGGIEHQTVPLAIREQAQLLQGCLANQYLIPQYYQGLLRRPPPHDLHDEPLCQIDFFQATIRILM